MRRVIIVTPHEIVFGRTDHGCDGKDMWHVWGKRKGLRGFWGETFWKEITWQLLA
jgi:hypothetical protein